MKKAGSSKHVHEMREMWRKKSLHKKGTGPKPLQTAKLQGNIFHLAMKESPTSNAHEHTLTSATILRFVHIW